MRHGGTRRLCPAAGRVSDIVFLAVFLAAYLAQSSPNDPMPGQSPPVKVVAFTAGPALGTVGVVAGPEEELPVAMTAGEPPRPTELCSTVMTPIAANAAAAPHSDIIFNRVDFIGTRLASRENGFPDNPDVNPGQIP